jgi:hypothetical protein
MSDWYQRRMARYRAEQPQPQPYARQQQPQPFIHQQPAPQQQPFTPPQGATNTHNLFEMMGLWRGGKAHRIDAQPCPECGSNQYFSRTGAEVRRGPPPAPHCWNCGYNGLFTQGLASNWSG